MATAFLYGWDAINSVWVKLVCNAAGKLIIDPSEIFEEVPTNNEAGKAPTSNWAFDHKANASAHHARYTDSEARAAVGYNGTKYWSCAGIHFDPLYPATDSITKFYLGVVIANADNITFVAQVFLPHGAVVTAIIVLGNVAATAETWELYRLDVSTLARVTMAGANINSADSSIAYADINNGSYSYFISTSSLDTNDEVWGVIITYTI